MDRRRFDRKIVVEAAVPGRADRVRRPRQRRTGAVGSGRGRPVAPVHDYEAKLDDGRRSSSPPICRRRPAGSSACGGRVPASTVQAWRGWLLLEGPAGRSINEVNTIPGFTTISISARAVHGVRRACSIGSSRWRSSGTRRSSSYAPASHEPHRAARVAVLRDRGCARRDCGPRRGIAGDRCTASRPPARRQGPRRADAGSPVPHPRRIGPHPGLRLHPRCPLRPCRRRAAARLRPGAGRGLRRTGGDGAVVAHPPRPPQSYAGRRVQRRRRSGDPHHGGVDRACAGRCRGGVGQLHREDLPLEAIRKGAQHDEGGPLG